MFNDQNIISVVINPNTHRHELFNTNKSVLEIV